MYPEHFKVSAPYVKARACFNTGCDYIKTYQVFDGTMEILKETRYSLKPEKNIYLLGEDMGKYE